MSIEASVILSSFNNLESLKLSLFSLECTKYISNYNFEIIIADDGSTDGTLEFLEREGIKFCTHKDDGYRLAKTWNDGAKISDSNSYRLIFGNSDIVWHPMFVDIHCREKYSKSLLAGLYPSIKEDFVPYITKEMIESLGMESLASYNASFNFFKNTLPDRREDFIACRRKPYLKHQQKIPPRYMYGGNWSTPRDVFEKLGGLDENFKGWGGEDFDYARRAQNEGVDVFIDFNALGYHLDHPTTNKDETKHIGKGYFNDKWN